MITIIPASTQAFSSRIFGSAVILVTSQMLSRMFDLVRMLIIARWLGPKEMGIYGVATLIIAALDQLTEAGLRMALIQKQGDINKYIIPVRSFQAVRGVVLGSFIYLVAPWVASIFNSPESMDILQVIALLPIIRGFEPLFFTLSRKELLLFPVAVLQTLAAFVGLVVGLTVAYYQPDAWALVWSSMTAASINTIGAHYCSPKNRLGFTIRWKPIKELSGFGFWIFMNSVISYIFIKGGDWVIGSLLDVRSLALYQMAFLICTLATAEVGSIVSQLVYPIYSRIQHDRNMLREVFRQSFGFLSIITLTIAGLVYSCSPDFFRLVLGEKWLPALPLVKWLTIWGVCSTFASALAKFFHALGLPKLWAKTVMFMTICMGICIYPMIFYWGSLGLAILLALIGMFMQLVRYKIIACILEIETKHVLSHIMIPAFSCIISSSMTILLRNYIDFHSILLSFSFSLLCFLFLNCIILWIGRFWIDPPLSDLLYRVLTLYKSSRQKV